MLNEIGHALAEVDTPCLWTDLDMLESNMARLAQRFKAAGVNWRPHTKGIKVPAIAQRLITHGAIGVTCAKLSEAEVMASAGITDILIANQIVGPIKTARLAQLCRSAEVTVAVDSEANVAELSEAAQRASVSIGVVVEVNIGMDRAGVLPGEAALRLSQFVQLMPGLRYRGVMGWEGHTATTEPLAARRPAIERAVRALTDTAQLCREAGLPVYIVSAGGSATHTITAGMPGVTEIQAGGGIFGDAYYRAAGIDTWPTLFVQAQVTSLPAPDRIICDAGFKSLPTWAGKPEPLGLNAVKDVAASAEHLTVTLNLPNSQVTIGDRINFIVGYGDATVFLHDQLYGVRGGRVEVVWPIIGRGKLQ
ncbi:MAG: DSD1 family PLP-dependent enzyme [Anaerolineales bacterium]